jgi:ribosome-binding factor A
MTRRTERINGLLRQEISQLLARELNDPRLSGVVSITQVETSPDLRLARVHVSVLGDQEDKDKVLTGIRSAAGFMRKELRDRLSLRYVPQLSFVLDKSLEDAEQIYKLMDGLSADGPSGTAQGEAAGDTGP